MTVFLDVSAQPGGGLVAKFDDDSRDPTSNWALIKYWPPTLAAKFKTPGLYQVDSYPEAVEGSVDVLVKINNIYYIPGWYAQGGYGLCRRWFDLHAVSCPEDAKEFVAHLVVTRLKERRR